MLLDAGKITLRNSVTTLCAFFSSVTGTAKVTSLERSWETLVKLNYS